MFNYESILYRHLISPLFKIQFRQTLLSYVIFFRLPSNNRNLINTGLEFLVPLSINQGKYYEEAKTRTIQHATRRKKRKKVSIHMHDTLKTNYEQKFQEKRGKKTTTKNGVNGIRTHIDENRWLLVYIYSKKRAFYILRYRVT